MVFTKDLELAGLRFLCEFWSLCIIWGEQKCKSCQEKVLHRDGILSQAIANESVTMSHHIA